MAVDTCWIVLCSILIVSIVSWLLYCRWLHIWINIWITDLTWYIYLHVVVILDFARYSDTQKIAQKDHHDGHICHMICNVYCSSFAFWQLSLVLWCFSCLCFMRNQVMCITQNQMSCICILWFWYVVINVMYFFLSFIIIHRTVNFSVGTIDILTFDNIYNVLLFSMSLYHNFDIDFTTMKLQSVLWNNYSHDKFFCSSNKK